MSLVLLKPRKNLNSTEHQVRRNLLDFDHQEFMVMIIKEATIIDHYYSKQSLINLHYHGVLLFIHRGAYCALPLLQHYLLYHSCENATSYLLEGEYD